jgi:RNA polymerase sigma-70 factor (ECF subfamily)
MTGGPRTTIAVQSYLDQLAGGAPAEPVVRALLSRSAQRLQLLCSSMLCQRYRRLTKPPLNLQSDEMLSAVVERLIKAMREVRPSNVRQFFGLANRHIRWELNELARRFDETEERVGLHDSAVAAPQASGSGISDDTRRILDAIESLPEEEREVFELQRIQGVSYSEAAALLEISESTVHRRLNRSLMLLEEKLADLRPDDTKD